MKDLVQIYTAALEGRYTAKELEEHEIDLGELTEINGDYYEEPEDHGFCFDQIDEEWICEDDSVEAETRTGYVYTHIENTLYMESEGQYYVNNDEVRSYFDIYFCDDCDEYNRNGCDNCSSNGEHNLRNYHDKNFSDLSNGSRFTVGFEVEKEDSSFSADYHDVEPDGWTLESDGSLDEENGFELISPILPLSNIAEVNRQIDLMALYINAEYSSNCGGHIHMADTTKTSRETADGIRGYEPLLIAMYPDRKTGSYSRAKKFDDYLNHPEKYNAINVTDKTVEIRIFPSPRNTDTLKFRAGMCLYMLKNPTKRAETIVKWLENDKHSFKKLMLKVYSPESIAKKVELLKQIVNDKEPRQFGKQSPRKPSYFPKYEGLITELSKNKYRDEAEAYLYQQNDVLEFALDCVKDSELSDLYKLVDGKYSFSRRVLNSFVNQFVSNFNYFSRRGDFDSTNAKHYFADYFKGFVDKKDKEITALMQKHLTNLRACNARMSKFDNEYHGWANDKEVGVVARNAGLKYSSFITIRDELAGF